MNYEFWKPEIGWCTNKPPFDIDFLEIRKMDSEKLIIYNNTEWYL